MNKRIGKSFLWILGLGLFFAAAQCQAKVFKEMIDKSFEVTPGELLKMKIADGNIDVSTHAENRVDILLTKTAEVETEEEAQELFDDYEVRFNKTEGAVEVIKTPKLHLWVLKWSSHKFKVKYSIKVPETFDVELLNSDGDIAVSGLTGSHKVLSSDGDIVLEDAVGDVELITSDGEVEVTGVQGSVRAITSDGDLELEDIRGDVEGITSDGEVELKRIFGSVSARSSDGDIFVELLDQPARNCEFQTTDGDIELRFFEDIKANVNVSVHGGIIQSDFEFDNVFFQSGDSQHVSTKLNGGGPEIQISTTEGKVRIEKVTLDADE